MGRKKLAEDKREKKHNTGLNIKPIQPLTPAQSQFFEYFPTHHICAHGSAGVGKSFVAMALAMQALNDSNYDIDKVVVFKNPIQTSEIGFTPGSEREKMEPYFAAFIGICTELFGRSDAAEILLKMNVLQFMGTSFLRGTTINNACIIVDEAQSMPWHVLSTIITRVGKNSKLIILGDIQQSDLKKESERTGYKTLLHVLDAMPSFKRIEFTSADIVRSGIVKEFILTCEKLGIM